MIKKLIIEYDELHRVFTVQSEINDAITLLGILEQLKYLFMEDWQKRRTGNNILIPVGIIPPPAN
jgi:hypothetical protein